MRFLIVAPRYNSIGEYYELPLGLAYISGSLKGNGYEVRCLNLNHHEEPLDSVLRRTIVDEGIDIVCTGGLTVHFHLLKEILSLAKLIKPGILSVIGGGIVSSEPELIMDALQADIGVIGEGEETIAEIAEALTTSSPLQSIKGIIFLNDSKQLVRTEERPPISDIDSIPFPDYEGFEVGKYLALQRPNDEYYLFCRDNPRILPIISSRSCPFSCTFCYHPIGKKYRKRSLDNFFSEVELLIDRYRINMLIIMDELLSHDKSRLRELCSRIKKYNLKWIGQLRVDSVDKELLGLMKDSGCVFISYGLESASNEVLKGMKKHTKVEDMEKALALTRENGIGIQGNFIFGNREETWETIMTTLKWWEEHSCYQIPLELISAYPGTEDYQYCLDTGRIKDRLEFIVNGCPKINMTPMSDEQYRNLPTLFSTYQSERRILGKVKSVELQCFDPIKRTYLYTVTLTCPNCKNEYVYRNFHRKTLGFIRTCCRRCAQRYDFSAVHLPHLAQGIYRTLLDVFSSDRPIAITPRIGEGHFLNVIEAMGVDWRKRIHCCLDRANLPEKNRFLSLIPVYSRTKETIREKCKEHCFLILPSRYCKEIRENLIGECGVPPEDIIAFEVGNNEAGLTGDEQ